MSDSEPIRWYLKRMYQTQLSIINIGPNTKIGRHMDSAVNFSKGSFQHVSKHQCFLTSVNGVATLIDETSSSGTYVNNRIFSKQHPGSVILAEGDLIGFGTPCNRNISFYRAHEHVLLYRVCKDRNCIVVSSDDEPEPTVDVQPEQRVPQRKDSRRSNAEFRILGHIDLSDDESDNEKRAAEASKLQQSKRNQQHDREETERQHKKLPIVIERNEDGECEELSEIVQQTSVVLDSEDDNEGAEYKKQDNQLTEIIEIEDEIKELFRDSYDISQTNEPILIDDSDDGGDDNDFSEEYLQKGFLRRIKQEAREIETEFDNEVNQEQQCTEQLTTESPCFFKSSDDEDEAELEQSRQWGLKLSQRNSPLRSKAIPEESAEKQYSHQNDDIISVKRNFADMELSGIEPLNAANCDEEQQIPDDFFDGIVETWEADAKAETESSNDNSKEPDTKRRKTLEPVAGSSDTSSNVEMLPLPNHSVTQGTNNNDASIGWIKRKVPLCAPHHIKKRGGGVSSTISAGRKSDKHEKSSKSHKPLKSHKPEENMKEARKQKLKEIQVKKSDCNRPASSNTKKHTMPKVKFTPNNRGALAFLPVEELSTATTLTDHSHEAGSAQIDFDDIVCTQTTSLDHVSHVANETIDIPVTKAPKLTFNSVAKVSSVSQNAPTFKIPKRPRAPLKTTTNNDFASILNSIPSPNRSRKTEPVSETNSSSDVYEPSIEISNEKLPHQSTLPANQSKSSQRKSILRSPQGIYRKSSKRVRWKSDADLTQTRTFEIEDGNSFLVETKCCKEKEYTRDMSLTGYHQNDIINEITSWDANWFDNPDQATITREKLLPMVETYLHFEDYKSIVMPILKRELFHDVLSQYNEVKKTKQEPIQMKVNQIRSQGRTFVLNCSVECSKCQSINNKDYVLMHFKDRETGQELRSPGVVTTRRQQIQYAADNGVKFFHATIEAARTPVSQRIRDGFAEDCRIQSLTQINLHMRQFLALFGMINSPLLDNILLPRCNVYNNKKTMDRSVYRGKEPLNTEQGDILLKLYEQCLDLSRPHIMLIQGPPGTGKSRLISNLVLQLHRSLPQGHRMKILICAQSNTAIDVIVLKLLKLFRLLDKEEQGNVLRTGTANKINAECTMVFLDSLARKHVNEQIKCRKLRDEDPSYETYYQERKRLERQIDYLQAKMNENGANTSTKDDIKKLQENLANVKRLLPEHVDDIILQDKERWSMEAQAKRQLVTKADIICTTLGSCGSLTEYNRSLRFDICIIDEATQATEIASFTPLQYDIRKLILVGDVKQLPPFVFSRECAEAGLKNSLFSRIQNSFIGTQLEGVKMLTTQYRMHPEIAKWPNEYFYEGKLTTNFDTNKCDFPLKPYNVFSLEYSQNMTQTEHAVYNSDEIQFVLKLLIQIMQYCDQHTTIAIITPYARHKRELEKYLLSRKIRQVSALSIDSVQGQEYDVVIISLARSIGTGFLDSPQRLNVALTRARKCLILCGNFSDLRGNELWLALLKDAEARRRLYHIAEENNEYDDVDNFVEKVMRHMKKL